MSTKKEDERKKKEQRQKNWLETYIFQLLQKSIEAAARAALDDLFKGWG